MKTINLPEIEMVTLMKMKYCCILLICAVCACSSPPYPHGDDYPVIDLSCSYQHTMVTSCRELEPFAVGCQSFNILPESNTKIDQINLFVADSSCIFFSNNHTLYQYTPEGEFIRKIGDSSFQTHALDIDGKGLVFILDTLQYKIVCYDYQGNCISVHEIPKNVQVADLQYLGDEKLLLASTILAHRPQTWIFDLRKNEPGELQHDARTKPVPKNFSYPLYCFYKYNGNLYGKYLFCDTVYKYTTIKATPEYLITSGKYGMFLTKSLKIRKRKEMYPSKLLESSGYIFITNKYNGDQTNLTVVDKRTGLVNPNHAWLYPSIKEISYRTHLFPGYNDTILYAILKKNEYFVKIYNPENSKLDRRAFGENELRFSKYLLRVVPPGKISYEKWRWDPPLIDGFENR